MKSLEEYVHFKTSKNKMFSISKTILIQNSKLNKMSDPFYQIDGRMYKLQFLDLESINSQIIFVRGAPSRQPFNFEPIKLQKSNPQCESVIIGQPPSGVDLKIESEVWT